MPNVLVIDDDKPLREMILQLLTREGIDAVGAVDGKEALKKLDEQAFDLLITDIVMPDMEGLELITHLRKACPDLPVIAISGGARIGPESYLEMARMLGARHTFQKPMAPAALMTAIRDCLE
mgnify:CR=1 FL=1